MIRRMASRGPSPAASEAARRFRTLQPIRTSYPDCSFRFKPLPAEHGPPEHGPPVPVVPDPPADDPWTEAADDFVWQLGPDPEGGEG